MERGNGRSLGGPGDACRKLLEQAALRAQPEPPQVGCWGYQNHSCMRLLDLGKH